jgi:Fe2+ or Zn2+ uptake regulation protein
VHSSSTQIERSLRDAALRVTAPRKAVLAAVHDHPHADTETLIAATRAQLSSVSHQAVYDVLRVLTDTGLVRRFQPAGSVARDEARVGESPCLTAADDAGFRIDEAEVVYWGLCPACQSPPGR